MVGADFGRIKPLKFGSRGRRWCQVLEGTLGALGLIEEIKSPCGGRGLKGIDFKVYNPIPRLHQN